MLQDCSSIFTAARYVSFDRQWDLRSAKPRVYLYLNTIVFSAKHEGVAYANVEFHCAVERRRRAVKKKKKKVESYMSPFHGLPRPLLQRHPLTCCSIYPQSGQKREENASSPRRKNALFIHRVYSFLCCKLVTVPVNSATANKAWWNNCRLVLRDKRVDRLTRLLLQTFSHH